MGLGQALRGWGLACGLAALIAACSGANAINTGPFSGGAANGDKNALCTTVAPGGLLSYRRGERNRPVS